MKHFFGFFFFFQIMDLFNTISENKYPKVLGLSATLLHANTKEHDFYTKIEDLKKTFRADVLTSNLEDVFK